MVSRFCIGLSGLIAGGLTLLACGGPSSGVDPDTAIPSTSDDPETGVAVSDADGDGYSTAEGDCDDGDASVYPGAEDSRVDGTDQDCDGLDGPDADGDGFVDANAGGDDCDDGDPTVHPDADEIWDDGIDQDCDGIPDVQDAVCSADLLLTLPDGTTLDLDGCNAWSLDTFVDFDPDKAPAITSIELLFNGVTGKGANCSITLHQDDVCGEGYYDFRDEGTSTVTLETSDCAGVTDAWEGVYGADTGYLRLDVIDEGKTVEARAGDPLAMVLRGHVEALHTSGVSVAGDFSLELFTPTVDQDGTPGCAVTDGDDDGDGFVGPYFDGDDCDDTNPGIHPLAADDWVDGVDQDCDGVDGPDADGDGFADAAAGGLDCDDTLPSVHPGAADSSTDGIDQDCDGIDGPDADGDGYADAATGGDDCDDTKPWLTPADLDKDGASTCDGDCDDGNPWLNPADADGDTVSSCDGDCNDAVATIYPGASDASVDGVDQDCDWVDGPDLDGDGYADEAAGGDDCDDSDPSFFPGAADLVGDGRDQSCDGVDGIDADGDGQASQASGGDDCDDGEASILSGAVDLVGDGVDQNCDGLDGVDADADGYASEASGGEDCDDGDPAFSPAESDGLFVDYDCDGSHIASVAEADYVLYGISDFDYAGADVSPAGDVDADGLDDILIGGSENRSYLVLGSSIGGSAVMAADYSFVGEVSLDWAGQAAATAGDVDGDGLSDLLFGAPGNDDGGTSAGKAYLVLGSSLATAPSTVISLVDADYYFLGLSWGATYGDQLGADVSTAGDVDDDGFDDLLIGAPYDETGGSLAGQAALVLGGNLGAPGLASPDYLFLGEPSDVAGRSVASAGDVDADGRGDFLVGAYSSSVGGSNAGKVSLILGGRLGPPATLDLVDADYSFIGENADDEAGFRTDGVGDVDGDMLSDFIVCAPFNADGGADAGKGYLILGDSIGVAANVSLADADYAFVGEEVGDWACHDATGAGDVDQDGFDDLLIGAYNNDDGRSDGGKAYLILGSSLGAGSSMDLADASYSFIGEDSLNHAGGRVAGVGDVNADGRADFLLGAAGNDDWAELAGKVYLILGDIGP